MSGEEIVRALSEKADKDASRRGGYPTSKDIARTFAPVAALIDAAERACAALEELDFTTEEWEIDLRAALKAVRP